MAEQFTQIDSIQAYLETDNEFPSPLLRVGNNFQTEIIQIDKWNPTTRKITVVLFDSSGNNGIKRRFII